MKTKTCEGCCYFEKEVSYCERFECETREHSIACDGFKPIEDRRIKMGDKMCNECKRCDGDRCTYFDNYSDRESTIACILFEPKKPTNGDRLARDREYMAAVIMAAHGKICPFCIYYENAECTVPKDKNCFRGVIAWLNAPAEGEENEDRDE